jgi:hypothetical protein
MAAVTTRRGRHTAVLGIEDARCWSLYGHAASVAPNPLSRSGVPTSFVLKPEGTIEIRHVIGAMKPPQGWHSVGLLEAAHGGLRVEGDDGKEAVLPYDAGFLKADS